MTDIRPAALSFYTGTADEDWADDYASFIPRVGEGVVAPHGDRYRVTGIWHGFEHNGVMNYGTVHVQLAPISEDDDFPREVDPNYYSPRG